MKALSNPATWMAVGTIVLAVCSVMLGISVRLSQRQRQQAKMQMERELRLAEFSVTNFNRHGSTPREVRARKQLVTHMRVAIALGPVHIVFGPGQRQARFVRTFAGAAVSLLPAADRVRYEEEFRSELCELAASDAGLVQQARYALRQLLRVVAMRRALKSPQRRSATP
jgi:hypothetical protein